MKHYLFYEKNHNKTIFQYKATYLWLSFAMMMSIIAVIGFITEKQLPILLVLAGLLFFPGVIPIEWMRYNMYIEDDRYRNIPMLVFRVQDSCPENIIDSLKKCVDAFKGNLNWKMFKDPLSRKGNYLITISELEVLHRECCAGRVQYNQIDFWGAEKYKKYCDDAIQDIPMLEKHIEETL